MARSALLRPGERLASTTVWWSDFSLGPRHGPRQDASTCGGAGSREGAAVGPASSRSLTSPRLSTVCVSPERVSHFPFPADTQRRGHNTVSVWKAGPRLPGSFGQLVSWRLQGPRTEGLGMEEGGRVPLAPGLPDLPGPSGPRLPLASPSCTSFTRSSGDGGSQALFQKVYF